VKELTAQAIFERALARAMVSGDPVKALAVAARDRRLPAELRKRLTQADPDGVRLSALLIARLRFERLLNGNLEASRWFEADPAGFSEAFREYHRSVAPSAFLPTKEAKLFRSWLARWLANQSDRERVAVVHALRAPDRRHHRERKPRQRDQREEHQPDAHQDQQRRRRGIDQK
jgi:hypothetical protein